MLLQLNQAELDEVLLDHLAGMDEESLARVLGNRAYVLDPPWPRRLEDVARRMADSDPSAPILSAKATANEMAIRVTSEAMQACGGAAMSKALPIERAFRDARAGSVMAPTTDVLYELMGRALVGMPLL